MSRKEEQMQRIEYLEVNESSNGIAYIDTGYVPTGSDIAIETLFHFIGYYPYLEDSYWYGTSSGTGVETYRIISYAKGGSENSIYITNGNANNNPLNLRNIVVKNTDYKISINGKQLTFNGNGYTLPSDSNLKNSGTLRLFNPIKELSESITFGRFHYFKLWKAEILQLDLIPVRIGDEGFMYDRVSGKLFGNAGTGRFILGPDIN